MNRMQMSKMFVSCARCHGNYGLLKMVPLSPKEDGTLDTCKMVGYVYICQDCEKSNGLDFSISFEDEPEGD